METIINITINNNWLEATWQEDEIQIHCESFSGHPEHIAMLEAKAVEFGTSLDEYAELIIQAKEAFVMPTDEEVEAEKRKQFEIQFRYDRDLLLKQADIAIYKAEDLGQDTKELRLYRQELRDATIDWILPESVM